ncbi:nuclear pore complex protein Nup88 [Sitophilus oryzae]|uniref:Nuclear pore complex protein Nup88 n=1 Tax=Sitophilus oryzae TaxID=7048 RepID=A0A6J2YS31_SITOR|nr:nuclear pore complex protein Nup88 [Sitophilus oryzae]
MKTHIRDSLGLCDHNIFREVCDSMPKDSTIPLNLVTVRDSTLFTWDFQNNCVFSIQIKGARNKNVENIHQKLLPLHPPLFSPTSLVCNESKTLLAVVGSNGILVLELPHKNSPYDRRDDNKEVIYSRSFSLDERLLSCSDIIKVNQVKFHPGSVDDSHILALTSDNMLRLYQIENREAINLAVFSVGEKPRGMFPGSNTAFLDIYGEIAVDFDFGFPEIVKETSVSQIQSLVPSVRTPDRELMSFNNKSRSGVKITPKIFDESDGIESKNNKNEELIWPVYILRGNCEIYSININLKKGANSALRGPYKIYGQPNFIDSEEACTIICLKTVPEIFSVATSIGTITNLLLLDNKSSEDDNRPSILKSVPTKELFVFERIELELWLSLQQDLNESVVKCKNFVFLHKDESKVSQFFAVHNGGVHSVNISCVEELQNYIFGPEDSSPTSDIFIHPSTAEYLVCTKTANSNKTNTVIGFSLYYHPTSVIVLLSDSSVITLGILSSPVIRKSDDKFTKEVTDNLDVQSPLKKMLTDSFDAYIQKILKKASSQPILKLSSASNNSPEECYDLLQTASQMFREKYFPQFNKVRDELEKRTHTLKLLKQSQKEELEKMSVAKTELRIQAGNLAEKYEDLKDKQDELLTRCEQLLMMVSRKKLEASDAEKNFMADLQSFGRNSVVYDKTVKNLEKKWQYQQLQIEKWKSDEAKKVTNISEIQAATIKNALQESSQKIQEMIKEVRQFKKKFEK